MSRSDEALPTSVTTSSWLLVSGLEKWILTLVPMGPHPEDGLLMMMDKDTGAKFLIKRVE